MAPTKGVILTGRPIRAQGREVPGTGLKPLSTLRGPGEAMDLGSGNQDADGTTDGQTHKRQIWWRKHAVSFDSVRSLLIQCLWSYLGHYN